jgi:hypothetical protein
MRQRRQALPKAKPWPFGQSENLRQLQLGFTHATIMYCVVSADDALHSPISTVFDAWVEVCVR